MRSSCESGNVLLGSAHTFVPQLLFGKLLHHGSDRDPNDSVCTTDSVPLLLASQAASLGFLQVLGTQPGFSCCQTQPTTTSPPRPPLPPSAGWNFPVRGTHIRKNPSLRRPRQIRPRVLGTYTFRRASPEADAALPAVAATCFYFDTVDKVLVLWLDWVAACDPTKSALTPKAKAQI